MKDNDTSMIHHRLRSPRIALLSLALHAIVLLAWQGQVRLPRPAAPLPPTLLHVKLLMEPTQPAPPTAANIRTKTEPKVQPPEPATPPLAPANPPPKQEVAPASRAAPPAPTAEEWQLASTYTLKNSKRYRYHWGQQVLSMMGTVVEGPQQGHVRFRIEIAPTGKVAKVETLWSTSEVAEKLARQSIAALPPLPPTPTGKALIFEQTIAYVPHDSGWPPIYKNDCLPDPPAFRNPFAWDGKSPQVPHRGAPQSATASGQPPKEEDCPKDGQQDSVEAEAADHKRQLDFWGALPLNGVK